MLAFLNEQIDKIVLLIAAGMCVFAALWMIHYNIDPRWVDKGWEGMFLVLGALLREVSGPIGTLIKSAINGKNGGNNVVEKK